MPVPAPLVFHAAGIDLHAHDALDEPTSHQAPTSEMRTTWIIQAVEILDRPRLTRYVERFSAAICIR